MAYDNGIAAGIETAGDAISSALIKKAEYKRKKQDELLDSRAKGKANITLLGKIQPDLLQEYENAGTEQKNQFEDLYGRVDTSVLQRVMDQISPKLGSGESEFKTEEEAIEYAKKLRGKGADVDIKKVRKTPKGVAVEIGQEDSLRDAIALDLLNRRKASLEMAASDKPNRLEEFFGGKEAKQRKLKAQAAERVLANFPEPGKETKMVGSAPPKEGDRLAPFRGKPKGDVQKLLQQKISNKEMTQDEAADLWDELYKGQ